jgi:hypothetical protein
MNRTRALVVGLAVPTTLAATALVVTPAIGSQGATSAVGTWEMTIDPRPIQGPTGQVDPPPFPSLVSFNRGGTLTESVSSLPGFALGQPLMAKDATSGIGVWKQKGSKVTFTFKKFLTKDGVVVGWQVVKGEGKATKKGTTQTATATFYKADGTQVGPVLTVDATGTRMAP